MSAAAILVGAKTLIRQPEHWCRHTLARSASGHPEDSASEYACSWCSIGAFNVASIGERHEDAEAAYAALERAAHSRGMLISSINDFGTHREVMAMFDRAIEIAREAEG